MATTTTCTSRKIMQIRSTLVSKCENAPREGQLTSGPSFQTPTKLVHHEALWHPGRGEFRPGRITRSMEIIAPRADWSYACRAPPNINRFHVNALGQSVPTPSF